MSISAQLEIFTEVMNERTRQNEKFGPQDHNLYKWIAILLEEVGEASQAILKTEFEGGNIEAVEAELIQVAAVSVYMLERIDHHKDCGTLSKIIQTGNQYGIQEPTA